MPAYPSNNEPKARSAFWITTLVVLIAAGLIGYGVYAWQANRKAKVEEPQGMMPKVSDKQMDMIKDAMRKYGRTVLGVTPQQEKAIEDIWKKPPRTLDEVAEYQKKTDEVLTPAQRQMVAPFRRAARAQVVDRIIEPAKQRMSPADFSRFRYKIQSRVAQKIGD